MATGAITEYVDVAQLVLYAFWVFFAALVYYLTVESKREGFPLEYDVRGETRRAAGIAGMPAPKTFYTEFWGDVTVPKDEPLESVTLFVTAEESPTLDVCTASELSISSF